MFSINGGNGGLGYFPIKKIPAIFTDGGDYNNNNLTLMNCNFYPSIDWGKWWVGIFSNKKKSPLSSQTAGMVNSLLYKKKSILLY